MTLYNVSKEEMKMIIIGKLKGKALKWYHSSGENVKLVLNNLLNNLQSIFDIKINKVQARRNFEQRLWKTSESSSEYYQDKLY